MPGADRKLMKAATVEFVDRDNQNSAKHASEAMSSRSNLFKDKN